LNKIEQEGDEKLENKKVQQILKTLGNKDCKQCGYETCLNLAQEIVKGNEFRAKCVYINKVTVVVDGKEIENKEFVQNFIAGTIIGMTSTLKNIPANFKQMEIKIERT